MKESKFVYAVAQDRRTIMSAFGINASSVSDALRFKGHNLRQRLVRSYAINVLKCIPMNVPYYGK